MDTISHRESGSNPTKICSKCKRELPATIEYFSKNKAGKYGLKSYCKQCSSKQNKAYREAHPDKDRQYYALHREERLKYAAEYHATHKEEHALYCKQYNNEHQEEIKARRSVYNAEHKAEIKERNAKNYQGHSEERRSYAAKYRQEHSEQVQQYREEHREEHRQYDRGHYQKHKERKHLYNLTYRQSHYDEIREKQKLYWSSERGRVIHRAQSHRRRSLKRNASGRYTVEELYQQRQRQRNKCYYCRKRLNKSDWHADHVIPLSRGGSNHISNIVITCPTCNLRKHNKLVHEWHGSGGRLL